MIGETDCAADRDAPNRSADMRMHAMIAAALWLCACAGTEVLETDAPRSLVGERIDAGGIGSLIVGMRVQDARLLGYEFEQGATDDDCAEWRVLPTASNGAITVLSLGGIITRVSVTGDFGIQTPAGVAIGSSSADVLAAYPGAVIENAEYFDPPAREIFVWRDTENWTGLHFVINEQDRVSEMQTGGALRDIEGCAPSP